MQAKTDQDTTIGLGLFDKADAPRFDLEDGKGPRTVGQIAAEFDAEQAAIDAIKGCL
jgi:ferredoxin